MKIFKKKDVALAAIDSTINELAERLTMMDPEDEEYSSVVESMGKLMKLRDEQASQNKIPPEVWMPVVANLLGICLVLFWEQAHVVTSKAFTLIKKR